MSQTVRLGLIGCGGMMRTHAQGVNLVKGIEIVAVCDIIRERAEEVAEVLNTPYITTDFETMVDLVDAVLIALPHDLHYECGAFFARHGKHVMMEKPLCNTEEECLSLIDICEEHNVVLMCAYPVRFWPGIVRLKELIDSAFVLEVEGVYVVRHWYVHNQIQPSKKTPSFFQEELSVLTVNEKKLYAISGGKNPEKVRTNII
jgi:predicted dehydrogenase